MTQRVEVVKEDAADGQGHAALDHTAVRERGIVTRDLETHFRSRRSVADDDREALVLLLQNRRAAQVEVVGVERCGGSLRRAQEDVLEGVREKVLQIEAV